MTRYYIEEAKCGYDTCFDGCGPHTTVASAIKYKEDNEETGWIYCIEPEGLWPMIALYDKDIYEQVICGKFIEGPDYEADNFGGLKWDSSSEEGLYVIKIMVLQTLFITHITCVLVLKTKNQNF